MQTHVWESAASEPAGTPGPFASDLAEAIFFHSPTPYALFRADGHVHAINPAWRAMFAADPPPEYNMLEDEIIRGMGLSEFVQLAFGGQVVDGPVVWYDPALLRSLPQSVGTSRPAAVRTRGIPLRDSEGTVAYVLIAYQDVTGEMEARREATAERTERLAREVAAREQAEAMAGQLQEAVRVRDAFLSVASHELKTPLTPLALLCQGVERALRDQPTSPFVSRVRNFAEAGRTQVAKLSALVNDLLDVSRITSGRFALHAERFSLTDLVQEVIGRYEVEVARASIHIEAQLQPDVLGSFDRLRVDQVISNLLDNALKYGLGRPVQIRLTASAKAARIQVTDQGIGIAPESWHRVFDRFERAASERHYGGLGLGLYIVREIVETSGGSVEVESELGHGSTFTVNLPM